MRILKVEIERFRGIKHLEWKVDGDFVCLVGPGDSTKTTILDAIEFALSPRWNLQFDDTDFYDADTTVPLSITVTVGELPELIKSDSKFGFFTRGWSPDGHLHDEPEEGDALVLSIQLKVDASLEPSWVTFTDRFPEGKTISAKDRESLGCVRLGEFLSRHFAWGRSSMLSRLTGEAESLAQILADVGRTARAVLAETPADRMLKLHEVATTVTRIAADVGVAARTGYRPHLDVEAVSVGVGGLSLHDGEIPLRRAGLGTRRLLAVAMQREMAKASAITIIDEVEHGLEPHRLRRLLRVLRAGGDHAVCGQVLITTHAPVALQELNATDVRIVRCHEGAVSVASVPSALQRIIQRATEAFVARKVIICEGKTELGVCRRLDEWWAESGPSFAHAGVALADGGGQEAAAMAKALADLGYCTSLLVDSDKPISPDRPTLESSGVEVFSWDGNVAIEERIASDLPWRGVVALVQLAMAERSERSVRDALAQCLGIPVNTLDVDPLNWRNLGVGEGAIRAAIGQVAKRKVGGWFKRVDLAHDLADIVVEYYSDIAQTDLCRKLCALRAWAHGYG